MGKAFEFAIGDREEVQRLKSVALDIRKKTLEMITRAGSGHPGGCLSVVEIVTALLFREMRPQPTDPQAEQRDRFLLSKAHASPALYAAMHALGYFPEGDPMTLRQLDSPFQGHPCRSRLRGIDFSGATPAQALGVANGMALAARLDGKDTRFYVVLGDGELQEGAAWEAAMTAAHYRLSSVCAIVDCNGLQLDGAVHEVMHLGVLENRWRSIGWECIIVNGHNLEDLLRAFSLAKRYQQRPSCILARTVKGKGVPFMENKPQFHYKVLTEDERDRAVASLDLVHC